MNESKIVATERLRREGRWEEASRFKDAAIREFRSKGIKKAEAAEAAWKAMLEKYPPLPPVEQRADDDHFALCARVGDLVSDWCERFGVDLGDDALAALSGDVYLLAMEGWGR